MMRAGSRSLRRQAGIVLLFGLVVMVALAFAVLSIVRSVDTGSRVAGSIAFRHDATSAAAAGAEKAMAWLQAHLTGDMLESDHEDSGYYASSLENLDPTGNRTSSTEPLRIIQWSGKCGSVSGTHATCNTLPAPAISINGNRVQWVITRLCAGPGPAGGANSCAMPPLTTGPQANDRGQVTAGGRVKSGVTTPYFRIIVRVEGPRYTLSTTEQLVHF